MPAIVHRSAFPSVEIPAIPITTYVFEFADRHPDRTAFVDGATGRRTTYGELQDQVACTAGGLRGLGVGPGDVVALMAPNCTEYALVFHGTVSLGAAITTVNPTYGAEEIQFQLRDAGASVLVVAGAFVDTARSAVADTGVHTIVTLGPEPAEGVTDFATLLAAEPVAPVSVTPDTLAALPYSSGTTGLPKGVMLTHRNLVANVAQIGPLIEVGEHEVLMAVLPFFHIYGMQVIMNDGLRRGATLVTMPRFDLVQFCTLVQTERATRLYVVPPIVLALAKQPVVADFDLSSVRSLFSGAAPLGADLAEEAATRVGAPVVQGYGMTELSPVSHATALDDVVPGSIGVLVPDAEGRIVDPDTGADQPVGGTGEIWVRGPMVMAGYLNRPDATAETIDADGWLHTGDIGHVDERGHWFISDRLKELIKVKGFQVPPAELEALLVTHPAVLDVAVIGVPDDEAGELPKAFVALKPGVTATAEELQAFVAKHVATYKQVKIVEFVDEIPKSASGKILRRLLRDR